MKKLITISGILLLAAIAINIEKNERSTREAVVKEEEVVAGKNGENSLDELLSHPEVLKAAANDSLKNELQQRIDELSKIKYESNYIQTMKSTKNGILVGYDFNITKNGISEEVASTIVEKAVAEDRERLEKYNWFNKLDDVRQGAVLNLTFNMGVGGFLKFKSTISHLNNGNYDAASKSLLYTSRGTKTRYYRQVKGRAKEVSNQLKTGVAKETFLDTLKRHEGFRKYPYRDTRGIWTVGYGINLQHRGFDPEESLMLVAMASIEDAGILKKYL